MKLPIYQVDAFASDPFSGNPAGVCLLEEEIDPILMQKIAMEMNLAETAFVCREGSALRLRWFTPAVEVDLCGHATLASSHVLWQQGWLDSTAPAEFDTRSGRLTARLDGSLIRMDFPAQMATASDAPDGLLESLGVDAVFVARNSTDYLIEVESADSLRGLTPDFSRLKTVPCRGVMVTCQSDDPEFDFFSRFFGPGVGIDEDPVTGSAHCCLAPYWAEKLGKTSLSAFQLSHRGGHVMTVVRGDRIELAGSAITMLEGTMMTA